MFLRSLGAVLSGLIILAGAPQFAGSADGPHGPGTDCQYVGADNAGYLDTCLGPSQAGCNADWCVVVGGLPPGCYCVYCASTNEGCNCDGTPVSGSIWEGTCQWGTAPPRGGECFCLFNLFQPPVPITLYSCS